MKEMKMKKKMKMKEMKMKMKEMKMKEMKKEMKEMKGDEDEEDEDEGDEEGDEGEGDEGDEDEGDEDEDEGDEEGDEDEDEGDEDEGDEEGDEGDEEGDEDEGDEDEGGEDNEEEKIMYFYPDNTPINEQMRSVGLSMAFINFAKPFSPSEPVEVVHTKQTRQVFLSPEPHFWLAMTIMLPCRTEIVKGEKRLRFLDGDVQDAALQSQIKQAYDMFKIFHGPMQPFLDVQGRRGLMEILKTFYQDYLAKLKFLDLGIVDAFHGLQFLPLDKSAYLTAQSFIHTMEVGFPTIQATMLLYDNHIVWSGLSQQDTQTMFWYFVGGFMARTSKKTWRVDQGSDNLVCLFGPESVGDDEAPVHSPSCHIELKEGKEPLRLVVYQLRCTATESLIVAAFIIDELTMATRMEPVSQSKLSEDDKHAVHIMGRLHSDLVAEKYNCELIAKTETDGWVVARKGEQREVFVILTNKHTNLMEIEGSREYLLSWLERSTYKQYLVAMLTSRVRAPAGTRRSFSR
eukprot:gene1366-4541_t